MHNIEIKNGKKVKCPWCQSLFAIKNDDEVLYRNITLLHFKISKNEAEVKCKQCKKMIQIDPF